MDEIVYNSLTRYFNTLEKLGYMSSSHAYNLLILNFLKDFVYSDYNALITEDDYELIAQALECLQGSDCLIPYIDYLKMGKLHLGEITELAYRIKTLENTISVKSVDGSCESSDIMIVEVES